MGKLGNKLEIIRLTSNKKLTLAMIFIISFISLFLHLNARSTVIAGDDLDNLLGEIVNDVGDGEKILDKNAANIDISAPIIPFHDNGKQDNKQGEEFNKNKIPPSNLDQKKQSVITQPNNGVNITKGKKIFLKDKQNESTSVISPNHTDVGEKKGIQNKINDHEGQKSSNKETTRKDDAVSNRKNPSPNSKVQDTVKPLGNSSSQAIKKSEGLQQKETAIKPTKDTLLNEKDSPSKAVSPKITLPNSIPPKYISPEAVPNKIVDSKTINNKNTSRNSRKISTQNTTSNGGNFSSVMNKAKNGSYQDKKQQSLQQGNKVTNKVAAKKVSTVKPNYSDANSAKKNSKNGKEEINTKNIGSFGKENKKNNQKNNQKNIAKQQKKEVLSNSSVKTKEFILPEEDLQVFEISPFAIPDPVYDYKTNDLPETMYGKNYKPQNSHLPEAIYTQEYSLLLFNAVMNDDISAIGALIDHGANINMVEEKRNYTPLMQATKLHKYRSMRYLITRGAYLYHEDKEGKNVMHIAAKNNDIEAIKILLAARMEADIADKSGNRPVNYITRNIDQIAPLLVYSYSDKDRAFLDMVALGSVPGVLSLIKEVNPNLRSRDKKYDGDTPIIIAVRNRDLMMLSLLIKYGSSPYIRNNSGASAFDIAQQKNYREIVDVIRTIEISNELSNLQKNAFDSRFEQKPLPQP